MGARLQNARTSKGLSKRRAAELAGFNEAVWRQLEEGERSVSGVMVAVNPRDETLAAAAIAVGLDPADLFAIAGREYRRRPDLIVGDIEIHLSASGVDLAELQRLNPEGFEDVMVMARRLLDRARDRKEGT